MNNPLRSRQEYEQFLYTLSESFLSVQSSKIVFIPKSARFGLVKGEVYFEQGFRLLIKEWLTFSHLPNVISDYSYEVWQGEEKLYWYDSQPHPDDATLASTHPHHKHIPPDIKHHWLPAPQISFSQPNLPVLIQEIEVLIRKETNAT